MILHAGDISTLAVLEELSLLGPPVEAVFGNADEPALRELLPKERVVESGGARIGMVHVPGPGAGRPARLRRRLPDCGAIVYGHTHLPEVTQFEGVWILNPGSPTDKRRAPSRTMIVLEVEADTVTPKLVELS